MKQSDRVRRRRATARRLHGEGLGIREIARRLGVNPSTISRDLREAKPASGPPPPEPGNQRAASHGAHSPSMQADLVALHEQVARERWPKVAEAEPHRLELWASHAARRDTAAAAERRQGVIRWDGEIHDVSKRLPAWESQLRRSTDDLDARERELAGPAKGGWGPNGEWPPAHSVHTDDPQTRALYERLAGQPRDTIITDPDVSRAAHDLLVRLAGMDGPGEPPPDTPQRPERTQLEGAKTPRELPRAPRAPWGDGV